MSASRFSVRCHENLFIPNTRNLFDLVSGFSCFNLILLIASYTYIHTCTQTHVSSNFSCQSIFIHGKGIVLSCFSAKSFQSFSSFHFARLIDHYIRLYVLREINCLNRRKRTHNDATFVANCVSYFISELDETNSLAFIPHDYLTPTSRTN